MGGEGDEDYGQDEDIIPGDNDKEEAPSDVPNPVIKDAPANLNHIPAQGGDIPIVAEPQKP